MAENTRPYCSQLSIQAGEPLFATATQTNIYLLLEYEGVWGSRVFEESDIPEAVKTHLNSFVKNLPAAKLQVIRTQPQSRSKQIRFFVANVEENSPALHAFQLNNYEELLTLDLPAILANAPAYQVYRRVEPLFLVCTNGRRDLCCGRYGIEVFQALLLSSPSNNLEVWQSSHIGGHRFAANLICFPRGLLYGRVRAKSAISILDACQHDKVYLPGLRGRLCYPEAVQAADYYLRQQTGEMALDAFHLHSEQEIEPGQWCVSFVSHKDEHMYTFQVKAEKTETRVYESCKLDKQTQVTKYILVSQE